MDKADPVPATTNRTKERQIQSIKALLIPLVLFLSTLVAAAGGFLIYQGYSLGWIFITLGTMFIVAAFIACFTFQSQPKP